MWINWYPEALEVKMQSGIVFIEIQLFLKTESPGHASPCLYSKENSKHVHVSVTQMSMAMLSHRSKVQKLKYSSNNNKWTKYDHTMECYLLLENEEYVDTFSNMNKS